MAEQAEASPKIPSSDDYFEAIQLRKRLPYTLQESLTSPFAQILVSSFPEVPGGKGTGFLKPTLDCSLEDLSFLMTTNFESAFHLSQLAHPLLKASGAGSIILISSMSGVVALQDLSIYGLTKGAMNQLARNLARPVSGRKTILESIALHQDTSKRHLYNLQHNKKIEA